MSSIENVVIPLTGAGDSTAEVAVDSTAQGVVQLVKLAISADGSSVLLPGDIDGLYVAAIQRAESPQSSALVAAALSAGSNTDLDATDIATGKLGRLMAVDVGGSVPCRCDIQTVNGPRVTRTTIYADRGHSRLWRPPGPTFVELTGGAGKHFGVSVTNLSGALTADIRATLYWDEVTP